MPIFVYYFISGIMGFFEGLLVNKNRPNGPYGAMWAIVLVPIAGWLTVSILGAVFIKWWHIFLLLLTGYVAMKISQLIFGR